MKRPVFGSAFLFACKPTRGKVRHKGVVASALPKAWQGRQFAPQLSISHSHASQRWLQSVLTGRCLAVCSSPQQNSPHRPKLRPHHKVTCWRIRGGLLRNQYPCSMAPAGSVLPCKREGRGAMHPIGPEKVSRKLGKCALFAKKAK